MKANIVFKNKMVNLDYVVNNSGIYSILKKNCINHRIVTFQKERIVCSIYVFDDGEVQPLEINCFDESYRFKLLDETIEIKFV